MESIMRKLLFCGLIIICVFLNLKFISAKEGVVQCGNLIYAVSKTSECFSDEFLRETERISNIHTERKFQPVKLSSDEVFKLPFVIMTGEGNFNLTDDEKKNLKSYLDNGGFLLASAGCSSQEWSESFKKEIKMLYPEKKLIKIELTHPIFQTVYEIKKVTLKNSGGDNSLYGLENNGKLVVVFSPQGLNDTANAKNCCCCGGNEILNSLPLNINILAYSLLY